jgi:hypothetical protein
MNKKPLLESKFTLGSCIAFRDAITFYVILIRILLGGKGERS